MSTQNQPRSWKRTFYNSAGQVTQTQSGIATGMSTQHDVAKPVREKKTFPLLAKPYELTHRYQLMAQGTVTNYTSGGWKNSQTVGNLVSTVPYGDLNGPSGWFFYTTANGFDIESVAITKALNQLRTNGKEREGTFDPGVAWRERNELGRMYEDIGTRTLKAHDALKSLNTDKMMDFILGRRGKGEPDLRRELRRMGRELRNGASKAPGAFARGWLAAKLAYIPLLADLKSAAEALAYRSENHHWDINCHAIATRRETRVTKQKGTGQRATSVLSETLIRSANVGFTAQVDNELDHRLAMLGLNNPLGIAYESAPLTFVADYFLDLGNWISALGAPYGCSFRTGFKTRYLEWLATVEDDGSDSQSSWHGEARNCIWKRSVLTNWPLPLSPFAVNPRGLNVGKITTLSSLLYARFMPSSGRGTDFSSRFPFRLTD